VDRPRDFRHIRRYWLGSPLQQAGFVIFGSAVILVGAGAGRILTLLGFLKWSEGRY
jgi:hypothetical protein